MTERREKYDIYDRIFNFVVMVLLFIEKLPYSYVNQIIRDQISRSCPSMGANSEEADGTNTKKDFVHCFTIVRKECKETIYWLRLIEKLNPAFSKDVHPIIQEGIEIKSIVTTIIKNTVNGTS